MNIFPILSLFSLYDMVYFHPIHTKIEQNQGYGDMFYRPG